MGDVTRMECGGRNVAGILVATIRCKSYLICLSVNGNNMKMILKFQYKLPATDNVTCNLAEMYIKNFVKN